MIWALLFTILAIAFGGDSPYMVPHLDNYVKTHVDDDYRKEKVLILLKKAKKVRKKSVKQNGKLIKEFQKLFVSREAARADFDNLLHQIIEAETAAQKAYAKANQNVQRYLTAEEWDAITTDFIASLAKSKKKRDKVKAKMDKAAQKWKDKIARIISDKDSREKAMAEVDKSYNGQLHNYTVTMEMLKDKNAVINKYASSIDEVMAEQEKIIAATRKMVEMAIEAHFSMVELTTPEEWNKLF